jgi:hypothetical protein
MKKDNLEIQSNKERMINEIIKIDKTKMFVPKPTKKISIIDKIKMILGYGKKG